MPGYYLDKYDEKNFGSIIAGQVVKKFALLLDICPIIGHISQIMDSENKKEYLPYMFRNMHKVNT